MSTPQRSYEALQQSSRTRHTQSQRKIKKALRDMQRKGLPISMRSLAHHAGVARKTVYNHTELHDEINAAKTSRPATPTPPHATTSSTVTAALRDQLRAQQRGYEADISALKAEIRQLNRDLAAAHGEIHRLRSQQPGRD